MQGWRLVEMSHRTEIKIEGMTCGHCVAAVKQALLGLPGVVRVQVDLAAGNAVVEHDAPLQKSQIEDAIEEEGYEAHAG